MFMGEMSATENTDNRNTCEKHHQGKRLARCQMAGPKQKKTDNEID